MKEYEYKKKKDIKTSVTSVCNGIPLKIFETEKFKTDQVVITFAVPLSEKSATYNTLLAEVLQRGCAKYPSMNIITNKLDSMYGAYVGVSSNKMGENHIIIASSNTLSKRFIDERLLSDGMQLMYELMYNPLLTDGCFDRDIFDREVKNLKDEIAAENNNKMRYTVERCLELICEDDPYKFSSLGTLSRLAEITPASLYEYYSDLLKSAKVQITAIGAIDTEELKSETEKIFSQKLVSSNDNLRDLSLNTDIRYETVEEIQDISQSKIAVGFKTFTNIKSEDYVPMSLVANMLGGGGDSLLFVNVREKESICYYIQAYSDKYKGLMFVVAGVENKNVERTLAMIDDNLCLLKDGIFSDELFENAKKGATASLRSLNDSSNSLFSAYYGYDLYNCEYSSEKYLQVLKNTTREDVVKAAGKIKKAKTFLLRGSDDKGEKN